MSINQSSSSVVSGRVKIDISCGKEFVEFVFAPNKECPCNVLTLPQGVQCVLVD